MNRYYYGLLFVLGTCLLLSLAYAPPFDIQDGDKGFFKYTGMAVLRGQIPYRDFFDHKPPMIFFLNFAGLWLGSWGLWLINTSLALFCTFLLFRLCRQYRLIYPWLLPFLFNLMIRDNLITKGANYTREYTTFFMVLFFCILLGKYRYRHFILGLLSALIFFTQQDQVLALTPFLFYALLTNDAVPVLARLLRLALGFLSVTLPIILYFAINRSLVYFWEDAFIFNITVYIGEKKSIGDHFRTIKRQLDNGNYEIPFMISLILGSLSLFLPNRKKGLVLAALIAMILSMSSELMGGRLMGTGVPQDFSGYFLPLSGTVCILLFTVFAFTEDSLWTRKTAQLPYALLLCCSLVYTAIQHGAHLPRRDLNPLLNKPDLGYLRQQNLSDYQLYVLFDDVQRYNELKILAPSRWVYQHLWKWYRKWDTDDRLLQSIGQDLLRHKTRYVVIGPEGFTGFVNPASREWWKSFMQTHYRPVPLPGEQGSSLWEWKD